jgi:hypothetical protein
MLSGDGGVSSAVLFRLLAVLVGGGARDIWTDVSDARDGNMP